MAALRQLELQLTRRCNLACRYCWEGGAARGPDLEPGLLDRALDAFLERAPAQGPLRIVFWGGEPLLRADLLLRAAARSRAAARGRALQLLVPTNLTLLDGALLDRLEEAQVDLSLSLDGGPTANAARRLPGGAVAWPAVERGLDALLRHPRRPLPAVRMTLRPARADRLAEDVGWLVAHGFRVISPLPASGASWDAVATAALERGLRALEDRLVAGHLRPGAPPCHVPPLLQRMAPLRVEQRYGLPIPAPTDCGAGSSSVAVACDGRVYPCHRFFAPALRERGALGRLAAQGPLPCGEPPPLALPPRCAACDRSLRCGRRCRALAAMAGQAPDFVSDELCRVEAALRGSAARVFARLQDCPEFLAALDAYLAAEPDGRALTARARLETAPDAVVAHALAWLDLQR